MPSPVAHSLISLGGFLITAPNVTSFEDLIHKGRKRLLFFLFLSDLPDFDMIVGLMVQGNVHTFHAQFSHSLRAAFLMASGLAFICPLNNFKKRYLTLVSMIIFHDLMDSFASSDFSHPGIGVQLLYPWKKHIAAPIPLFYGFHHKKFNQLISLYNLKDILIEIVLWGSVNLLILRIKNQRLMVL